MEIDFSKQFLSIGIREFVSFAQHSYPHTTLGNFGNWRTQLGQHWHQQLWQETATEHGENAQSEVSIKGTIQYDHWTFELSGRIDQLIHHDGDIILREIKTTQQVIPLPKDQLQRMYPDYFEQLACYHLLLNNEMGDNNCIRAELCMLHIDTGIRQNIVFDTDPLEIIRTRLKTWVDFLNGQKQRDDRIKQLIVPAAFEHFREDQIPVRDLLLRQITSNASEAQQFITLQAATGFGKTSIAMEWALKGLQQGNFDRVLYVTGKNTGQMQVMQELQRFQHMAQGIRFFQIRNMDAHLGACPHLSCPCRYRNESTHTLESFIPYRTTQDLLEHGSPSMQSIAQYASNYQLCPRLISQSCLSHAEFWVADYNYVFSSNAQSVMDNIPGFNPERTLLIVDEAHNLHERVASNHSAKIRAFSIEQLISLLHEHRTPRALLGAVDQIRKFCYHLDENDRMDITEEYQLFDLLEHFQQALTECGALLSKLPQEALEQLWELSDAYQVTQKATMDFLHWVPRRGVLEMSCINASSVIRKTLETYQQVLFMSATFPPQTEFEAQTRLNPTELLQINASSTWRNEAYTVAIDCRVNTSYKRRQHYYNITADTLAMLSNHTTQPVIAFFPSYQYAATVAEYVKVTHPHLRVLTLSRELNADQQIEFIQNAIHSHDVFCLPLGSGLSEGIDVLGGKIDTLMIVSPSLPEVNALQHAKSEQYSSKKDAFRSVYLVPGLTKVNQALGRIVRNPDQHARVLLHCDRFAQADYQALLSEEYQHPQIIRSTQDLEAWLMSES